MFDIAIGRRAYSLGATLLMFLLALAPVSAQDRMPVSGRVVDAATDRPLSAVAVHAGDLRTLTDDLGRFGFEAVPSGATLHFERLGYRTVMLTAGTGPVDIRMEPVPLTLEAMFVETHRGELLASNSALAVTQIDNVELQTSAATSLAEGLDRWEGVSVSRVGSWGSRPALRGLSGERLAILVDGNRINRACTYGMDQGMATIDPATVERVEIITGPGSTAYGSGNVGGVINVVTRHPEAVHGVSGEVRASASSAVPGGGLGGSLALAGDEFSAVGSLDASSYGDYRTPEAEVPTSGYRQLTGDIKLDYEPSASHRLSLQTQYYGGRDIGWPMRGGAEIPEETRTSASLAYGWTLGEGVVEALSARAYFQKLDHHMVMTMTMEGMGGMPMTSTTDGLSFSETSGGRVQIGMAPWQGAQIDVGTEVTHLLAEGTRWIERVMGTMDPVTETFHTWPGVTITDVGTFFQGDQKLASDLFLSGGMRLDRVDRRADEGSEKLEWVTTGNVGLRAGLTSWLSARGTVGVGYRTPDAMELYGLGLKPDGYLYRGRSDLATEKSFSRELALTVSKGSVTTTVTGFMNRIDDMVVPAVTGDTVSGRPVREYQNIGQGSLNGVSGTVQSALPAALSVYAQASWTRGEDDNTGAALPSIPPLEGGIALRRDFGASLEWVEVEWRGAARQDRVAEQIGELETRAWGVVDLRASAALAGTRLAFGVENVLDEMYRAHLDPYTLYRPGRNFFLKMSRSF